MFDKGPGWLTPDGSLPTVPRELGTRALSDDEITGDAVPTAEPENPEEEQNNG